MVTRDRGSQSGLCKEGTALGGANLYTGRRAACGGSTLGVCSTRTTWPGASKRIQVPIQGLSDDEFYLSHHGVTLCHNRPRSLTHPIQRIAAHPPSMMLHGPGDWEALSMNVTRCGSPIAGCRPAGICGQGENVRGDAANNAMNIAAAALRRVRS